MKRIFSSLMQYPLVGQGPLIIRVSQSRSFWHTTLGRTPLDEWSARRRSFYLTTHNTTKRETSLPPAGFEPAIPASEQPKTHGLDRATTRIGSIRTALAKFWDWKYSGHCSYLRTPVCTIRSSNNYITIHRRRGREAYYFRLATKQVCPPTSSYCVAALCQGQAYLYHLQTRRSITVFTNTRTLRAL